MLHSLVIYFELQTIETMDDIVSELSIAVRIRLQMDNPNPVPDFSLFTIKNGVPNFGMHSGGIPTPVSITWISTSST